MEILVANEFVNLYKSLPTAIKNKAVKQERLFIVNPFHPSLRIEKLEPKDRQLWSIRIDKVYRIVFRFIEADKVLFLTVGHHKWIYKNLK